MGERPKRKSNLASVISQAKKGTKAESILPKEEEKEEKQIDNGGEEVKEQEEKVQASNTAAKEVSEKETKTKKPIGTPPYELYEEGKIPFEVFFEKTDWDITSDLQNVALSKDVNRILSIISSSTESGQVSNKKDLLTNIILNWYKMYEKDCKKLIAKSRKLL
jgi:hypothetical protein